MGRKPRIEFNGAVYHVIQRGNNKEYIFKSIEHKKYLLTKITEIKKLMDFEVFGFVLMDNHYHMVIKCHEDSISSLMHRINGDFGKYYNISFKRSGHVFQGRYKGILVKDNKHLLSLLRYVHQNPVKANICKRVCDYKWSSDSFYRYNKGKSLVNIDFILNIFSPDRKVALKEYVKFMDVAELEESIDFEDTDVIGETEEQEKDSGIPLLDDILNKVTEGNEHIINQIKAGSRIRELTCYKKLYIEEALSCNYSLKEIGDNIGISKSAIWKLAVKE